MKNLKKNKFIQKKKRQKYLPQLLLAVPTHLNRRPKSIEPSLKLAYEPSNAAFCAKHLRFKKHTVKQRKKTLLPPVHLVLLMIRCV